LISTDADGTPITEAIIETLDSKNIVSTSAEILTLDMMTADA
jgi:hypothetical protein